MKLPFLCWMCVPMLQVVTIEADSKSDEYNLNLPPEHMAYYFTSHPKAYEACKTAEGCPYKKFLNLNKCWGYEPNCPINQRYSSPVCNKSSKGWSLSADCPISISLGSQSVCLSIFRAKSKEEQVDIFFRQGDFGFIRERREELITLCTSNNQDSSFLECSKYMRFCRGRNIMFDFKTLESLPEPMRYRDDVIREGQVGGYCKLNKELLRDQGQHKSPLQSWYAEFEHFTELHKPLSDDKCDINIEEPTFIMKLDATVNMYHHFCDFFNLYATLHLNDTFTTDIQILIWDTIPYGSNFAATWGAFTRHPIMNLFKFKGKKVCFKNAVFPLLPRMIFGMYYNMPLVPGCQGSGLFKAFTEHLQHRLQIKDNFQSGKVRVTFITRSTQYRRILNEDELISSLKSFPDLIVRKINFNRQMAFINQLEISYNTDILIGIHGAGLTHMLFMPEWGAIFEIFNCEDESCYADLARLKGLKYLTWEKRDKLYPEDEGHHPTLGAHAKFTNYSFDVKEFLRIFTKALKHVKKHSSLLKKTKDCEGSKCNNTFIHNEL